jgi:hypothetical protein
MLIAYATEPGKTAIDGTGTNSPFTTALLRHIRTPGLEVNQMLTRVRVDVVAATSRQQTPWVNSALLGEVYLAAPAGSVAVPVRPTGNPAVAAPPVAPPVAGPLKPPIGSSRLPIEVARFGDWTAFVKHDDRGKTCFVDTTAKRSSSSPANFKRDGDVRIVVSQRPTNRTKKEIYVFVGYDWGPQGTASLQTANERFALSRGDLEDSGAAVWLDDTNEEGRLIDLMRRSSEVVVSSTFTHGRKSVDIFSLRGFASAIARADAECAW